ncbi:hypothetical protein N7497_012331 [Penicillium chrysogenum]|nr:hypothetical protein N7497_012331 [Penicillium chrysogenum]
MPRSAAEGILTKRTIGPRHPQPVWAYTHIYNGIHPTAPHNTSSSKPTYWEPTSRTSELWPPQATHTEAASYGPYVASKGSKNLIPKDLSGSQIPHSQRWLYSTSAITNSKLKSVSASAALVVAYVCFNSSAIAVNIWGTFVITTVFFWVWAAVFAVPDLTGWPRWLFKYKTQPFVRVGGRQYARIALIGLRNQFMVVLPLLYLSSVFGPSKPVGTSSLPSPTQAVVTALFDVFCTEMGFYYVHRA